MLPKVYGDRVVNEHIGKDGGAIEVQAQVSEFLEKLALMSRRKKELSEPEG